MASKYSFYQGKPYLKEFFLCLLFAILASNTAQNSGKREVRYLIYELQNEIQKTDSFEKDEYFTKDGWKSIAFNFRTREEFRDYASHFSTLEVGSIKRKSKLHYLALIGDYDPVAGRSGLVLIKEKDSYKIIEYLPPR